MPGYGENLGTLGIETLPISDPREQFIANKGYKQTVIDPIVRKQQDLIESYEGTGVIPQTFPDWVARHPDASGMMNTWGRYDRGGGHSGSIFGGSPRWMDAQSQWRRPENIEKQIDTLEISPEFEGWSRDEIKAYIFRSIKVNRGGIIGLI